MIDERTPEAIDRDRKVFERNQRMLKTATLDYLKARLSDEVYRASHLIEELEGVGRCCGNGHHAAQNIAAFAVAELERHWIKQETASVDEAS